MTEDLGSSFLCHIQAVWSWVSRFTSLVLASSSPQWRRHLPHRAAEKLDSLCLVMVTNTICGQEAQKDLRIKEELSGAPGPGLQKTHDCETGSRLSSWSSRPQALRRRLFAPDLITQPAGASHSHCFSSLGVCVWCWGGREAREQETFLPSLLHQPNPSPSPGPGPLKGDGGSVLAPGTS